MVTESYRSWKLKSYHQQAWPPFKQYICTATKTINKSECSWNMDGSSIKQAENLVKERIDDGDIPSFDNFPKLSPCVFE